MSAQEVASGEATKLDLAAVRAEVVGSLLRPRALVVARGQRDSGEMGAATFKREEDREVVAAIRLQESAGIDVSRTASSAGMRSSDIWLTPSTVSTKRVVGRSHSGTRKARSSCSSAPWWWRSSA